MQTLVVKGLPHPSHDFELIPSCVKAYHVFLQTILLDDKSLILNSLA